jgi:AcrR family transcriptional regulator
MHLPPSEREDTTERIIDAAGSVFAERGFRATTVRQITARAGVNLAAVNYHFKNKAELYLRVLKAAKRHMREIIIAEIPGDPEERIRIFIDRFVRRLLDPKRPLWHGRVIAMEMSNPTPALGVILRDLNEPIFQDLRQLIGKMVGSATAAELDLLALSIVGQCVFYACCRPASEQLGVHLGRVPDRTGSISRHIGDFSIGALKDFRRRNSKPSRSLAAA